MISGSSGKGFVECSFCPETIHCRETEREISKERAQGRRLFLSSRDRVAPSAALFPPSSHPGKAVPTQGEAKPFQSSPNEVSLVLVNNHGKVGCELMRLLCVLEAHLCSLQPAPHPFFYCRTVVIRLKIDKRHVVFQILLGYYIELPRQRFKTADTAKAQPWSRPCLKKQHRVC